MSAAMSTAGAGARAATRPGPELQRLGGLAAHVISGTYVVGFVAMIAYFLPRGFRDPLTDPAGSLRFLSSHEAALSAWYAVLYLVGGLALVMLVLALGARVRSPQPTLAAAGQAAGLLWSGLLLGSGLVALVGQRAVLDLAATDPAAAATSWHAVSVVQDALGGGIELVGGAWLLLTCFAALRCGALPPALAVLGLVLGVVGLGTVLPVAAASAGSAFGLGLIVWFTWTAHNLLRRSPGPGSGRQGRADRAGTSRGSGG